MSAWLIVDLRSGQVAAGLFDDNWPDLSWVPLILPFYASPGAIDNNEEFALAFFCERANQKRGNQNWSPIPRENLANLDPESYEWLERPLETTSEALKKILQSVLNGMLKEHLENYINTPVLLLTDRRETLQALTELAEKMAKRRPGSRVCYIADAPGYLTGFTCLDPQAKIPPIPGEVLGCTVLGPEGQPQSAGWTWQKSSFLLALPPSKIGLSFSISLARLERAGAALFALHWQIRLAGMMREGLNTQQANLTQKRELVGKMDKLLDRLAVRPLNRLMPANPVKMS